MKKLHGGRIFIGLVALVLLWGGLSPLKAEEIKIGFIAPLTGYAAEDGLSAKQGAQLAISYLRQEPKANLKDLKIIVYDDQGDYKQATSLARKLILDDKVSAVVSGSYSGPTKVIAPICQELKTPLISAYAVHPDITKSGDYVFRMIYTGDVKGKALVHYATKKMNHKKFAMLFWEKEWGASIADGVKDAMKDYSGNLIFSRSFSAGEKDFSPYITAIREAKPDLLFVVSIYAPGTHIVKKVKELGLNIPLIAPDGLDASKFPGLAGSAAEGVLVVSNFSRDDKRKIVQQFIQDYQKNFKEVPDMVAASSFDAVKVLGEAISTARGNPAKIKETLATLRNVEGVCGKLTFTPEREVSLDIIVNKITQGKYVAYDRITFGELSQK